MMKKIIPQPLKSRDDILSSVGWFAAPYITNGELMDQCRRIAAAKGGYSDEELEQDLKRYYYPGYLAAMLVKCYSKIPIIRDYQGLIGQALEAYFLGNYHLAFSGLVGMIEGVIRKLSGESRRDRGLKKTLLKEINSGIYYINQEGGGVVKEIEGVLASFYNYAVSNLYVDSDDYLFSDGANRHAALHGVYTDEDYGRPLAFLKLISCLDALTFILVVTGKKDEKSKFVPLWNPGSNEESVQLATYYVSLMGVSKMRSKLAFYTKTNTR